MQKSYKVLALLLATLVTFTYLTFTWHAPSLPQQWQRDLSMPNAGNNDSYKAPMLSCDHKEVVPDEYAVFLHRDYSLDDHKAFVGDAVDFDSTARIFLNETATHGLTYFAHFDKHALAAVRANIGVDLVECDSWAYSPEDI